MSEIEARREEVGKWIAYARADLAEAELNIRYGGAPNLACYHAQQAAEKMI